MVYRGRDSNHGHGQIVQARMWAQGLTIGVLIAAGALTHARRQQALDEYGHRHIVRTPPSRPITVLMTCCRNLITRGEILSRKRAQKTMASGVLEDLGVLFTMPALPSQGRPIQQPLNAVRVNDLLQRGFGVNSIRQGFLYFISWH